AHKQTAAMLCLEPCDELVFEGPFNRAVCKKLVISNPSKTTKVAFKMKTTSPKLFFVRPNIGMLGPDETVVVDIFMQPIVVEPVQKRHKFLIQGAELTGEVVDLTEFWKTQKPSSTWGAKIKCDLVHGKANEVYRQAGGTISPRSDDMEFDAPEVSEREAKLLKQVSLLEDECQSFKEEIHSKRVVRRPSQRSFGVYFMATCILLILAAFVGAFYGKHYL
ncbi:hypothetical protein KR009_001820, partial [Drosophila setifemur]